MPKEHETDLIAFLHEASDLRVQALAEQAHQQPDFKKINQTMLDFMESVTDEDTRATLLRYEALKNDYIALLMPYLYEAGAKDSLAMYGLLSKKILTQN
jgi:hypothetical protein